MEPIASEIEDMHVRDRTPREPRPRLTRATTVAMSILLLWHSFAMVIGPAPASRLFGSARWLAQPYLTFFGLQNQWGFFAPDVKPGYRFSYEIEDAAGEKHRFTPADHLNNLHPDSIWKRDHYTMIMTMPDLYGDAAGAELCLEHASLGPVHVTLLELEHQEFSPDDWRNGKRPTDDEFVSAKTLRTVTCPGR